MIPFWSQGVRIPLMQPFPLPTKAILAVALLMMLVGCTRVLPYERGILARPTMNPSAMTGVGEEHVFEVHEGAAGGGTAGGGGCGCN
jgi:hypothetical protein